MFHMECSITCIGAMLFKLSLWGAVQGLRVHIGCVSMLLTDCIATLYVNCGNRVHFSLGTRMPELCVNGVTYGV